MSARGAVMNSALSAGFKTKTKTGGTDNEQKQKTKQTQEIRPR
jgi:hypothetical protein